MSSSRAARQRSLEFLFAFCCVFGGLSLPTRGLGPSYVRAHAALGNLLLPHALASGAQLSFRATDASLSVDPWTLVLLVEPATEAPLTVPIDLRLLLFLPTACFVALCVATPLARRRQNAQLALLGLLILEPLLLLLSATPLLSFLGGTGPVRAFQLGLVAHTLLQLVYRALVASPGMTYVIPLLLWLVLVSRSGRGLAFASASATPPCPPDVEDPAA